ncbi:MAG: nucleotidyltransferase [Bacilli bacterium]|nr:nucleotidyltransferase [Bacilli bacterium]
MDKELTLVIMAAGMGSRFGGLKQVEPMGPNGEFIIDYSIYDAVQAGFNKVVFIIREENYELFKEKIGNKLEKHVKVEYAFQEYKDVPEGVTVDKERTKPLGTGHALYCARKYINGPFAVISADDYYGREPFSLLADSLKNTDEFSIIGYQIGNTITDNGSVKRGVCFVEGDNLVSLVESKVEKIDGVIHGKPLDETKEEYTMEADHPVSMLMYGLRKELVDYLVEDINDFFKNMKDPLTQEYLLPDVLDKYASAKGINMKVIPTTAKWYGVTYKEDAEVVRNAFKDMVDKGIYPDKLWN